MKIRQIRNATLLIEYGGVKFLVDPMLSAKSAWPAFAGTANDHLRNPTVDLVVPMEDILAVDAVIVTHTHTDHWDKAAAENIPADTPIYVQHFGDKALVSNGGYIELEGQPHLAMIEGKTFTNVKVLTGNPEVQGVKLRKVPGQHGSDVAIEHAYDALQEVCGVVFSHPGEKTLYLAGDTVWNEYVEANIAKYAPEVIILNAGDAQIPGLGAIIMDANDVLKVCEAAPEATIVASHFEAVNHGVATRDELRQLIGLHSLEDRVLVPEDGETVTP
ncbi:MBL fold metallo-hydrolase [Novosphingobium tardum]|uniref:MBL fold metallo-hydrolase n=1 Tax=Novosphingobium tardum TaxID=1538021 RepID=A0ABV8RPB7_9SPHN